MMRISSSRNICVSTCGSAGPFQIYDEWQEITPDDYERWRATAPKETEFATIGSAEMAAMQKMTPHRGAQDYVEKIAARADGEFTAQAFDRPNWCGMSFMRGDRGFYVSLATWKFLDDEFIPALLLRATVKALNRDGDWPN